MYHGWCATRRCTVWSGYLASHFGQRPQAGQACKHWSNEHVEDAAAYQGAVTLLYLVFNFHRFAELSFCGMHDT